MAADFNRDVAPLGIEDVEGVVVHIGHRLLGFDVMVGADVPHRRLGTAYQNQKQALRNIGLCQVFFGQLMLALPGWTMDNRNAIGFRISMNATAKAARQAHQVCVVQRLLRSGQGLPPYPKTAGAMPHAEKSIQYDPIHTIVAAGQQFRIPITQRIWHVLQINMR